MHESTRTKALSALDGMREIVRREMVAAGAYVDEVVTRPKLATAICGGRLHCAIGSLWAGAGVRLERNSIGVWLPGAEESDRDHFLRPRHGLRAAYDALNTAAETFSKQRGLSGPSEFEAPIEALFEGHYGEELTKRDLLRIIASAKRTVKAA